MAKSTPLQFIVPDMDCQSCVSSITAAVRRVDADATVAADLATKRVIVGSDSAAKDIGQAIEGAGFSLQAAG